MVVQVTNLPDDWGYYYYTCARCGERYHASGTEHCACGPCEGCDNILPPELLSDDRG